MLRSFIRWADGSISRDTDPGALHRALSDPKTLLWLDMQQPTEDEYELLAEVFQFHELAIEDSVKYAQRPKIEKYAHPSQSCPNGYYYMVFHGPDLETFRHKLRTKEIDIFMADHFIVTIHDEQFRSVEDVQRIASEDPRRMFDAGLDLLLHQILDRITDHYQPILDYLEEALNKLEDDALDNPRPELLGLIADKKRELLNLRRTVGPQREVVAQLARGEIPLIRESSRVYFRDVQDHLIRIVEMVELYRDLVLGARDMYLSSISNHLNQIMKTLTIISVIGLPLTIVTGFFGMNFDAIPGLHSPLGFWCAVGFMGGAVTFLLYLFRRKSWI